MRRLWLREGIQSSDVRTMFLFSSQPESVVQLLVLGVFDLWRLPGVHELLSTEKNDGFVTPNFLGFIAKSCDHAFIRFF